MDEGQEFYDQELADRIGAIFGKYLRTFRTEEVRVDLFLRGELLRAYAKSTGNRSAPAAIGPVLARLNAYPGENGYSQRVHVVFT